MCAEPRCVFHTHIQPGHVALKLAAQSLGISIGVQLTAWYGRPNHGCRTANNVQGIYARGWASRAVRLRIMRARLHLYTMVVIVFAERRGRTKSVIKKFAATVGRTRRRRRNYSNKYRVESIKLQACFCFSRRMCWKIVANRWRIQNRCDFGYLQFATIPYLTYLNESILCKTMVKTKVSIFP